METIDLLMCLGCRWIESVLICNGMESVLTSNGDFEWLMEFWFCMEGYETWMFIDGKYMYMLFGLILESYECVCMFEWMVFENGMRNKHKFRFIWITRLITKMKWISLLKMKWIEPSCMDQWDWKWLREDGWLWSTSRPKSQ